VTLSPTFTFSSCGVKVKLSMLTVSSWAWAGMPPSCSGIAAATTMRRARLRKVPSVIFGRASALQRRVDDRKTLITLLEVDAGNSEHAAQLGIFHLHRSGRRCGAGRRLRERGGACGVEGNIALDLLHDLVNVTVEHRDRAKSLEILEGFRSVLGAPAPLWVDRPERDVGKQHDRGRLRFSLQVSFEPFELFGAEIAKAAGL